MVLTLGSTSRCPVCVVIRSRLCQPPVNVFSQLIVTDCESRKATRERIVLCGGLQVHLGVHLREKQRNVDRVFCSFSAKRGNVGDVKLVNCV